MNSSINWIFLWRRPIQNHPKPRITEKRRNKAKYLTWNSTRPTFVKKTSMPNSVKSLECFKCYRSSSPRPVKSSSNFIRYNCQKICSWLRKPKTILEIRKKHRFLQVINTPIIYNSIIYQSYYLPLVACTKDQLLNFIFQNHSSFVNLLLHLFWCGDGIYICKIKKNKVACQAVAERLLAKWSPRELWQSEKEKLRD